MHILFMPSSAIMALKGMNKNLFSPRRAKGENGDERRIVILRKITTHSSKVEQRNEISSSMRIKSSTLIHAVCKARVEL